MDDRTIEQSVERWDHLERFERDELVAVHEEQQRLEIATAYLPPAEIELWVAGKPEPAGSKRAFINKKTGRLIVTDDNPKSKGWKKVVAAAAFELPKRELLAGPLQVDMLFVLERPAGHYGTGRNALLVKPSAPVFPVVRPDVLKLARGVEDALTGEVWEDDAQIVVETLRKVYVASRASEQGVRVRVVEIRAA